MQRFPDGDRAGNGPHLRRVRNGCVQQAHEELHRHAGWRNRRHHAHRVLARQSEDGAGELFAAAIVVVAAVVVALVFGMSQACLFRGGGGGARWTKRGGGW